MKDKILALIVIASMTFASYLAFEQSLARKAEAAAAKKKAAETPATPSPGNKAAIPATPPIKEQPVDEALKGIVKSNHFTLNRTNDHTYRIGFMEGLWPSDYPKHDFYKLITGTLLDILKKQKVQMLFLAGTINVTDLKSEEELMTIERNLVNMHSFITQRLGDDVRIFPVIECSLDTAPVLMPIVYKAFHIDLKDPLAPFDITLENAAFVVTPTHQFDNKANINNELLRALGYFQKHPKYFFVVGYDAAFPIAVKEPIINMHKSFRKLLVQRNEDERNEFWKILTDKKIMAYFCFGEPVFNRVLEKGVWQIITGEGEVPTSDRDGVPPFYHAVILRLPALEDIHPTVQALDLNGDVVDELDLTEVNGPLHQFHIPG